GAIAILRGPGVNWACAGVSLVFALRTLVAMWIIRQQDGVSLSAFLQPMAMPLAAGAAMAGGVVSVGAAMTGVAPAIRLLVEVATGAAIYVVGVMTVARSTCD